MTVQLYENCIAPVQRCRLAISGTVQGVGFRPFLYRRALARGLSGFACNDHEGVCVEIQGRPEDVAAFIGDLRTAAPIQARVRAVAVTGIPPVSGHGFEIRDSRGAGTVSAVLPPDLGSCDACLAETLDAADRRYRYAFTHCTDCGPRYSIMRALPYDRASTSMSGFAMCPECAAEYTDPGSRRFHAEANACPACGPQVLLCAADGTVLADQFEAVTAAAAVLRRGGVMALKGLGGFQLLADARNEDAVARLRARKRRPDKPLAVMLPSLADVLAACEVSAAEADLLTGRERPIVLLRRRPGAAVAVAVAPDGNPCLGVMLPATPLHHLLLRDLGFAVVATSGNRSEEPIAIDNDEARERLAGIADAFLLHDRDIVRAVDDSVTRIFRGRPQCLRRARGYAPAAVAAATGEAGIFALGGHLKAAVALSREEDIILSPHIGDLDGPLSRAAHAAALEDLQRLYGLRPRVLACDVHPDYHSTRQAEQRAAADGLPLVRVQHHLAHVAAGMAEHGLAPPLLGAAWDGTGYGTDGGIWGGEFLLITDTGWERFAHFRPFRLPGGAAAVREPRRAALGLLYEYFGEDAAAMTHLPTVAAFTPAARGSLAAMLRAGVNAPACSSAGRLFDAVASLLGLCQVATYEGQAACRLEWAADGGVPGKCYDFSLAEDGTLDWRPALHALLDDLAAGVPAADIARAFHAGLAAAVAAVAAVAGAGQVLLTGGCFQNALLGNLAADALTAAGRRVYWHEAVPPGDGGLALGQAWWAARLVARRELSCA